MMVRLLHAEMLKLRTTRTFAALVAAALALQLLVAGLMAALVERPTHEDLRSMLLSDASSLFILVLGIVGAAGEWRHRTIAGTLLAAPRRRTLVAAKALAYGGAGVLLSLVVTLGAAALSAAILGGRGEPTLGAGDLPDILWRNALLAASFGALGVGVGALIRNQPTAIVLVLVSMFVIEPLLGALAPDVAKFGPFLGAGAGFTGTGGDAATLPPGLAVLVLLCWVAAACAAAAETLARRDVT
jgi:hypothetical protein